MCTQYADRKLPEFDFGFGKSLDLASTFVILLQAQFIGRVDRVFVRVIKCAGFGIAQYYECASGFLCHNLSIIAGLSLDFKSNTDRTMIATHDFGVNLGFLDVRLECS